MTNQSQGSGGGFEVSTGIPSPPPSPQVTAATTTTAPKRPSGPKARNSDDSIASNGSRMSTASSNSSSSSSGEGAAYTIREECERLFCETLKSVFLGEGNATFQDSLRMGAHTTRDLIGSADEVLDHNGIRKDSGLDQTAGKDIKVVRQQQQLHTPLPSPDGMLVDGPLPSSSSSDLVSEYMEVWDYAGGLRFRAFVAEKDDQKTLFVFFDHDTIDADLKSSSLVNLLELAGCDELDCSQLVVCLDRESDQDNLASKTKSLGFIGFELLTLEKWSREDTCLSADWLFLGMDV